MHHIVLFKFRDSADEPTISHAFAELRAAAKGFDGLMALEIDRNLAADRPSGQGYTHVAAFRFRDRAAFDAWSTDAGHIGWGKQFAMADGAPVAAIVVADFGGSPE